MSDFGNSMNSWHNQQEWHVALSQRLAAHYVQKLFVNCAREWKPALGSSLLLRRTSSRSGSAK
jgi:hypothetical protein